MKMYRHSLLEQEAPGVELAIDYGVRSKYSRFGEVLLARSGDGMLTDERIAVEQFESIVTPEEADLVVVHCIKKDIEMKSLNRPLDVEDTLRLGNEMFDTYFYDSNLERKEMVSLYANLITSQLNQVAVENGEDVIDIDGFNEEVDEALQSPLIAA